FSNLPASNAAGYTITETQPAGFGQGKDRAGTAGGTTTIQDVIGGAVLGAHVSATGYLFGEASAPGNGTILGTVFVSNNGTASPVGQPPVGGVTIALRNSRGGTVAVTTTAGDGSY